MNEFVSKNVLIWDAGTMYENKVVKNIWAQIQQ